MRVNDILTADWHLTDNPDEEYRWEIFPQLLKIIEERSIRRLYILGDMTDRKDRHSGNLLNRLTREIKNLIDETGVQVIITMGNHDKPLAGTPYWEILNLAGIQYVTSPLLFKDIWLLPFASNPDTDWAGIAFSQAKAIFMHQTVAGSMVAGGRVIEDAPHPMPILPRGIPIFSGDVHRPQKCGAVTYIGAPHPVSFAETWRNRVLLIKHDDFAAPEEIYLRSIHREIFDVESSAELKKKKLKPGDQVRVRFHLTNEQMTTWPVEETAIRQWAIDNQVVLASVEGILSQEVSVDAEEKEKAATAFGLMSPADTIRAFSLQEKLDEATITFGLELLKEALA